MQKFPELHNHKFVVVTNSAKCTIMRTIKSFVLGDFIKSWSRTYSHAGPTGIPQFQQYNFKHNISFK